MYFKIYNSRICIYPPCLPVVFCVEITAFSDRHAEFEKLNTEILGVSIDSVVGAFPVYSIFKIVWNQLYGYKFWFSLITWVTCFYEGECKTL